MEEAVLLEDADDRARGVDADGGELAHEEEAEDVVEVGAGEDDCGDGGVAQTLRGVGVDFGVVEELLTEIGGGVDQEPGRVICRHG